MNGRRAPVIERGIRVVSPIAIVAGVFLLFAGHNNPGGGFAAGLVFGAVVILRAVAGIQRPAHAIGLISFGVFAITAVSIAPLFWGDPLLDQRLVSFELPVVGEVKTGSALPFDIAVSIIVVGLISAIIDGLSDPAGGRFQGQNELGDGSYDSSKDPAGARFRRQNKQSSR